MQSVEHADGHGARRAGRAALHGIERSIEAHATHPLLPPVPMPSSVASLAALLATRSCA
jgi:hypothetical protein